MTWIFGVAIATAGTYALRVAGITMLRGRTMSERSDSSLRFAALGIMAALAVSSASSAATTSSPWAASIGVVATAGAVRWTGRTAVAIAVGVLCFWVLPLVD